MQKDKKYLITGATGFLGEKLVERLYSDYSLRVLSRNEGKLIQLQQRFPEIEILTGDIKDSCIVKRACKGINGIFHLAAFKHVTWAENQVNECIGSNVTGTHNILKYGTENKVEFILGISTDKAAQVNGTYGATKFLMEKMFSDCERNNPEIRYRIVRYGNVLYSTGSVLCKWKDLLQRHEEITVTDLEATRFFWTREQAIDLIFECLDKATDSSPYCPEMKSMKVGDLLEAMQIKYGTAKSIKTIGLQKGENLHEKILENGKFSNEVERYNIEEIIKLI